jgi:hypothetical protein
LRVRVERAGKTVFGMNITKGGTMGDDHITWLAGRDSFSDNSFNGGRHPSTTRTAKLPL